MTFQVFHDLYEPCKNRDLASLETYPRYWQKARVKRRQNSFHVYPRLKPGSHMLPTYLDTITTYVNIYRRIMICPRQWPPACRPSSTSQARRRLSAIVNDENTLSNKWNGWKLRQSGAHYPRQFDLNFASIWVQKELFYLVRHLLGIL